MQDNAGMASSPFLAFNMQALCAEDAADLQGAMARGMLRFDKVGVTMPQAFQAVNVPSCISENLTQQQFWANCADEISTPRFNAGDGNVSGAGKTASGLSMLMGASFLLLVVGLLVLYRVSSNAATKINNEMKRETLEISGENLNRGFAHMDDIVRAVFCSRIFSTV